MIILIMVIVLIILYNKEYFVSGNIYFEDPFKYKEMNYMISKKC